MAKLTEPMVEELRQKFEAGDAGALLDAIDFCARSGMPLPVWLAEAYCARYENWAMYRVKTLDEAFGVGRPKKMHIDKAATRERLKPRVAFEVLRLSQKMPIDEHLFACVGRILRIGGGQAKKLYYRNNLWVELLATIHKPQFTGEPGQRQVVAGEEPDQGHVTGRELSSSTTSTKS